MAKNAPPFFAPLKQLTCQEKIIRALIGNELSTGGEKSGGGPDYGPTPVSNSPAGKL
jgi:hypothetical protein